MKVNIVFADAVDALTLKGHGVEIARYCGERGHFNVLRQFEGLLRLDGIIAALDGMVRIT